MGLNLFKSIRLYIKIGMNRAEGTNLETGESISREAIIPFSTNRFVIADFNIASKFINELVQAISPEKKIFGPQKKLLIQQVEEMEGGLPLIEKRALRDLGEMSGASHVYLVEHFKPLSINEAIVEMDR